MREGSDELKSILSTKVQLQEDPDHRLWIGIWNKPSQLLFCLWFRVKPTYGLLVEAGWVKIPAKRKDFLKDLAKDMKFHHWDDGWRIGYEITSELTPELEGNADSIKNWYERAARLAIEHRKAK